MSKTTIDLSKLPSCCACDSSQIRVAYNDSMHRLLRCMECGLHFVNPIPGEDASLSQFWNNKYDSKRKVRLLESEKKRASITASEVDRLFKRNEQTGNRLLDIGCGRGFFLKELMDYGWEVFGCEHSTNARDYAKNMSLNVDKDLKNGYLWKKDFYDVITLWNVLDCLHDPLTMLNDCKYLLRQGGTIIVRVPNFPALYFFESLKLRGKDKSLINCMDIPTNLYYFSVKSVKSMLQRVGFTNTYLIPSPVGDLSYAYEKRFGPVKTKILVGIVEALNLAIVKLSRSRSAGFLSITMIARKPEN